MGRHIGKCKGMNEVGVDQVPNFAKLRYRIMYIEEKFTGVEGDGRIGKVYFSKTGKTLYYNGMRLQSLKCSGFKSNYYDVDSGEEYWISGPRIDQNDRLYGGNKGVQIDEDAQEEYDSLIRQEGGAHERT